MSRVPKWTIERTKVKVVFRLQFHATQIPQSGWDKLFISFVPNDVGKATAKTSKANVRNGTCKWADPVYETTRLFQDPRTKKYDEKVYKLVVAMGSSKSSLLGEVNINLSEYADFLKPSTVALPLHSCDYGSILHVTVQLLTSKTGFREFEQQREFNEKSLQRASGRRNHDNVYISDVHSELSASGQIESSSLELTSPDEGVERNAGFGDSATGHDGSSYTSESLLAEKNDTSSHDIQQGLSRWTHVLNSDYSMDNDMTSVYEENNILRGRLEAAESTISQLKIEANSFRTLADKLGFETQCLVQQIAAEFVSGERMTAEVSNLKCECLKLKDDIKDLQFSAKPLDCSDRFSAGTRNMADFPSAFGLEDCNFLHHSRDFQIDWLQGILLIEGQVREIQNKANNGYHENAFDFLRADFEVLEHLLDNLKQGLTETALPVAGSHTKVSGFMPFESFVGARTLERPSGGQKSLDGMVESNGGYSRALSTTTMMEEKLCKLSNALEDSKINNENLLSKMNKMECYYESLIQEFEEAQKHKLFEMEAEHASCSYTISSLQNQVEKMHLDMNAQFIKFSDNKHNLEILTKKLEKRAVLAEAVLKKVRRNYTIAVDRLHKDLELLSLQVLSMYEINEHFVKQAVSDTCDQTSHLNTDDECAPTLNLAADSEYLFQEGATMNIDFQSEDKEIEIPKLEKSCSMACRDRNYLVFHADILPVTQQFDKSDHQVSGEGIYQKFLRSSPHKQMGFRANTEAEFFEVQLLNLTSEVFLEALKGTMHDLNGFFRHTKGNIAELAEQQRHATELKESLVLDLEAARHESRTLKDNEDKYIVKCDDLLSKNRILDAKFQDISDENRFLALQVSENEELIVEYKDYERKYEALLLKKGELQRLKESLVLDLEAARHESRTLKDNEAKYIVKCDDLLSKNRILDAKLQDISDENSFLARQVSENEELIVKYKAYERKYEALLLKKGELEKLLKAEIIQKDSIQTELSAVILNFESLREDFNKQLCVSKKLQDILDVMLEKMENIGSFMHSRDVQINGLPFDAIVLKQKMGSMNYSEVAVHLGQFHQGIYDTFSQILHEKEEIEMERNTARKSVDSAESQIATMKHIYEIKSTETSRKLDLSSTLVEKLQQELDDVGDKHIQAEEKYEVEKEALLTNLRGLENELQCLVKENEKLSKSLLIYDNLNEELERSKVCLNDSMLEIAMAAQHEHEASVELKDEVVILNEKLRFSQETLLIEKGLKEKLNATVCSLTLELKEEVNIRLSFEKKIAELGEIILVLEEKNSSMQHILLRTEELQKKEHIQILSLISQFADMESVLVESSVNAKSEMVLMRTQFHTSIQALAEQCNFLKNDIAKFHLKQIPVACCLKEYKVGEIQLVGKNARLETALQLKSEFDIMASEKDGFFNYINKNSAIVEEFEDSKTRCALENATNRQEKQICEDKNRCLKILLSTSEKDVETLKTERDELEITCTVLLSKLYEQKTLVSLLEEYDAELRSLREQHQELTCRLSEQIIKTEEFKNLCLYLRDLKDKAEVENVEALARRGSEGASIAIQESLRIAFIKEQYETKLQDLGNQLSISKKHAEELFLKFQDALDEVEDAKKREASVLKKNEELSMAVSNLETEIQIVAAERKELVKAYDRMNAELECSVLTLDCCKEEKLRLEASLQECSDERMKIRVELDLVKRLLENLTSNTDNVSKRSNDIGILNSTSIGKILEDCDSDSSVCQTPDLVIPTEKCQINPEVLLPTNENNHEASNVSSRSMSYGKGDMQFSSLVDVSGVKLQQIFSSSQEGSLSIIPTEIKEQFKEQELLKIEMNRLHKELEKLKNDNLAGLLPPEDHHLDQALADLENGLSQLEKANEHLGSIYPLYREFPGTGNALERVLALELELAESLQVKKLDRFQSSFLRQHGDDDAVFQSFRDINELIRDMLELKKKNAAIETELKEMHSRYSHLSLQLAEVEGERQKLHMTLKNRSPRKPNPA